MKKIRTKQKKLNKRTQFLAINTIDKKTRNQIYRIIKTHKDVLDKLS